jgi:hypothetical protein
MLRRLLAPWRRTENAANARAHALFDRGDYAAAAAAYSAAMTREPDPSACVNLGYCHLMLREHDAAGAAFGRALDLRPGFAAALVGLGDCAAQLGEHPRAVAYYDAALAQDPELAVAHNNRAQSLFAMGRTLEAWREAEWRYAAPGADALYPHRPALPRWQGEALPGRLLVHWEQGYGDIIQHLRFLPLLRGRVAAFAFECPPPLLRLAARLLAPEHLLEAQATAATNAGFAAYVPLLSLPHALGLPAEPLPPPPYLHGDGGRAHELRSRWAKPGVRLVGIAWRGSDFDASRNASLQDFAELSGADVRLVSLQKYVDARESALLADLGAVAAAGELDDFAATADAIAALDLVVSVDTAVAHLAGALDKPTCLLLNEPAAVRWMLGRGDTPWYPSTRLLRKSGSAPWVDLLTQARAAIREV